MARNILTGLKAERVSRLDFAFEFREEKRRAVDVLIGRAAHVNFLDSPVLPMTLLLNYHADLFPVETRLDEGEPVEQK